jgi:hypothetical protein
MSTARPSTSSGPAPIRRTPSGPPAAKARVRKVRSTVIRLDPWSVMKVTFVLSAAMGIALVVMFTVLWGILSAADVIGAVDRFLADLTGSTSVRVADIFSLRRVIGFGFLLAALQAVLVTALVTLGAFLYNLTVGLVGGLEATVSEQE